MKRRIQINQKILIYIYMVIIIFLLIAYTNIIIDKINKIQYANKMIQISEKNKNPIFSIEKIYVYSSANVIDKSIERNLQDLDIYQFADIAIYINNKKEQEELTNKNTIKELYIDNISLETESKIGERGLYYTNYFNIGKATEIEDYVKNDRIDFDIKYTNDENNNADYSKPTFYTDCSNPITLRYLNKDVRKGYKMDEGKEISFDGKLLKEANVSKEEMQCKVTFRINLVNNNEEKFSCWLNFNIPLDELYTEGKVIKSANTSGNEYNFFYM